MRYIVLLSTLLFSLSIYAEQGETPAKDAGMDSLKLLSWNIYMLPPVIKMTGKRKRAAAIGDTLSKSTYDVLVLQEAFHHGARRILKRKLQAAFPYQEGPLFRKPLSLKTSSGIWILSKHPIQKLGSTKYRDKWGFDNKMARKGAVMVEIIKNKQPFQIIGTHLNSGGPLNIRTKQVRQIKEDLIDVYHRKGVPLIVAGDFNIERKEQAGLDSMMCIMNVGDYEMNAPYQFTYDGALNDLCASSGCGTIDYIFVNTEQLKVKKFSRLIPTFEFRWSKKYKSLADHNPLELFLHYKL